MGMGTESGEAGRGIVRSVSFLIGFLSNNLNIVNG
jgi:hypothetical protein